MNIPEKFWKVSTGLVGVLIALAAIFIVKEVKSIGYVGANPNQTNTINVDGTGDAYAIPDVATFSFSVTETGKTVTAAQAQATTKVNAALSAVKAEGVADKDIQTTGYNINPHYEYQNGACMAGSICTPGKSVLTGYDVSETVTVKVRNLDNAGTIFASIGSLEVQNVNGLDFSVDNPDSVQAQARDAAIADAQSKAGALASKLGVRLVRIVSFTENNGSVPGPIMYAMNASTGATDSKAVAPEIAVGQQKVTDNVTITYEIE